MKKPSPRSSMILPGSLAEVFDQAARVLKSRGLAKGVTILPDGEVDVFGAILLAVGARRVVPGDYDPERSKVPDALIPLVLEAYETLYGLSDDLDVWMDEPIVTVAECVSLLHKARDVVSVSIWRGYAGGNHEPLPFAEKAEDLLGPD
jgi:hypothetical protein